jgi:hypothetical protein
MSNIVACVCVWVYIHHYVSLKDNDMKSCGCISVVEHLPSIPSQGWGTEMCSMASFSDLILVWWPQSLLVLNTNLDGTLKRPLKRLSKHEIVDSAAS